MVWLILVVAITWSHGVCQGLNLVNIDENKPLGTHFEEFQFSCSDKNLNWTVSGVNDSSAFHINMTTNKTISVSLTRTFNHNAFTNLHKSGCWNIADDVDINVKCKAPEQSEILLKVVSFALKNTSASYFCNSSCNEITSPLTIHIQENTTKGTHLTDPIKICDDDIVYKDTNIPQPVISAHPTDIIDYHTKGLQLVKELDYETTKNFTTNLTGNDGATLEVIIKVVDIDDQGIQFTNSMYNCSFCENKLGTIPNCKVTAMDLDLNINTSIKYQLISESPDVTSSFFQINETSGSIEVKKNLDREAAPLHVLYIKGYQEDRPYDKINYTTVIINVLDEDDHPPNITEANITVNVSENIPIGSFICQVTATDNVDQGKNAQFVYKLVNTTDLFELCESTGLIKSKKAIDREKLDSSRITMKITAESIVKKLTSTTTAVVHINILDENDNSPVFNQSNPSNVTIKKTQHLNESFYTAMAIDKDIGDNGKVQYSLENYRDTFDISQNGCITLKKSLNESFSPLYVLTLKAEDQAKYKRSSTMILHVHVEDVNIHPPKFVGVPLSINVSEAIPPETILLELKAEDKDPNDKLTFALNETSDIFYIHNNTSSLRTKSHLDRENKSVYHLTLLVSDSINNVTVTVKVQINDENDNSPVFKKRIYEFNVTETTKENPGPKRIGRVEASDADEGINGSVAYKIEEDSQWKQNFTVNHTTGEIEVQERKLDRDIMGEHAYIQFSVIALDAGCPPRIGVTLVKIQVIGVNDNIPAYQENDKHVEIYINEGENKTNLFVSQADDHDIGTGSDIRYNITKDETGAFEINSSTGSVQLKKALHITSENKGRVNVTVEATNPNGTANDRQILSINIMPANINKPVFQESHYKRNVSECTERNTELIRVTATDKDSTRQFNTVYYWIEPNKTDTVYVQSVNSTGMIYLVGDIDFDESKREIEFKVYATDDINDRSTKNYTTVTLTITNCNDNPPVFTKSLYKCNISEGIDHGTFNCGVNATDIDNMTSLKYSIVKQQQQYSQNFSIDSGTGIISSKSTFDFESLKSNPMFLNVSAFDGDHTSYCEVVVEVINTNDEPPVFQGQSYEFNIIENIPDPYYVGFINVTDADSGLINLTLENCRDQFYINNTGEIFAHKALDYEKDNDKYVCNVIASDNIHTKNKSITIHVLDVNDNPPTFNTTFNVSIKETVGKENDVITVNASDNDKSDTNSNLTYSIFAGDVLNKFAINISTGVISLKDSLDGYGGQTYQLSVKAIDHGTPPLSGYTIVTIRVLRTNNNPPKFTNITYHAMIYENSGNQTVLQVSADDIDGTDKLKYNVVNNADDFYVNDTGILFATNVNAEKYALSKGVCKVLISVSDGTFSDNTTVFITIVDENDNFPYFNETAYTKTINDTTAVKSEILEVVAFDEDITNDGFTFIIRNDAGFFEINSTTGQINLIRPLSQNVLQYEMVVEVFDSGNPPKHNETRVIIDINDTNTAPTFNDAVLNQTVNENDANLNISLAAIDNDTDQAGNVTYSIYSLSRRNNDLEMFHFDSTNARLTLANASFPLNFEERSLYEFTVIGEDHGVFPKSTAENVTLYVKDINERPYIAGEIDHPIFVELNTPVNTAITVVTATDPDVNNANYNKITYTLGGNETDTHFKIDNNGTVYTKTSIDQSGNYSINVTLKDNGNLTSTTQLAVVVPEIKTKLINISVLENQASMNLTSLSEVIDGYDVSYKIQPSSHSGKFTIVSNKNLRLIDTFDKETTSNTSLWIYGRTTQHGILVANYTVKVDIQDVNDCPPEFPVKKYIFTFDDVMATDATLGEVIAIDRDFDRKNRNVSYRLLNNNQEYIRIGETTGEIFVGNISSIQPDNISLIASAYDGNFSTNVSIDVIVLDTNNNSPYFNVSKYEFTMVESNCTDKHCNIGAVNATDSDLNKNGEIVYKMIPTEHKSPFYICAQSGKITAVGDVDREENNQFIFTVCAFDLGNRPRQCCVPVTINILDINDNAPKFSQANYAASVKENSKINTTIAVVPGIAASDNDTGDNGTEGLRFSLNVTDGPICISNQYPVSVYICNETDRETQDTYYLSVEAQAFGNKSASVPFIVYIKDENDETPEFTKSLYTFNVTENANASKYIGKVSVTDKDLNGTANIIYSIENGDTSPIYIDGIEGILYVGGNIDREKDEMYSLNISAYDGKNFNYTSVDIFVEDVNDNPPRFRVPEREIITINVTENVEYGIIRNISAHDKDEKGSNSELVFKLQSDDNLDTTDSIVCNSSITAEMNDNCFFAITETGQLNLTRALDRELKDHYSLIVTVSDRGKPPLSSSMTININVLDENDNDPIFDVDGKTNVKYSESYMIEKVPENSVLKLIKATDPDFGINGTFTYSIEDSVFSKFFKIGKNSGVVSVAQAIVVNTLVNLPSAGESIIDTNETAVFNLTIIATDGGGRKANMTLVVFIDPLNDEDVPVFEEMVFNFKIPENERNGSYVGTCLARIVNETYSHMNYSLISGYKHTRNDFSIDSITGAITTRIPLDRESIDQYTFAVKVRDGRIPERTAFAAVEIEVTDVNDNDPVFHSKDMNVEIPENSPSQVFNVSASDRDLGQNGTVSYSLIDDFDGYFVINKTTGILKTPGHFDYERENHYTVEIVASDSGMPQPRNSSMYVNVSILDENDNAPKFIDNITSVNITENSPPHELFSVIATDEDSGWNGYILYVIVNEELTPFVIDAFSGVVYLRGQVDYEQRANYTLTILAKDQGKAPLDVNKTVNVNILDIYDDVPRFQEDTYDINITSTMNVVGTSLIEFDVGAIGVEFNISGPDAKYFKMVDNNFTLAKELGSDRRMFVITVHAKDRLNQTTSCSVIAHTSVHAIAFGRESLPVTIKENLQAESILIDINSTEEMKGHDVVYAIAGVSPPVNDSFTIESHTGVLRCTKPLDREDVAQYTISISVRSSGTRHKRDVSVDDLPAVIQVVVNVTDENDNPPKFPESHLHTFGVPDNVRANYIVTTIKAYDPDVDSSKNIRYNVTGEASTVFGVNQRSGNIITLVAIASVKKKRWQLTVTAYDVEKTQDKAEMDLFIFIVTTEKQPYLFVPVSVAKFNARKEEFIRNMSRILGVEIQAEKIEGHLEVEEDNKIPMDLSKTDFYFHGFNTSEGNYVLISNEEMKSRLENNANELSKLFGGELKIDAYQETFDDPSAITSTQILLICMAVFIFIGSAVALFFALSTSRYDNEYKTDAIKEEERKDLDIELSTIRSRQSSKMSSITAAAAVNPAFHETELTDYDKVQNRSYESQEIRVNFRDEPMVNQRFGSQSVIDSGVGNTSVHSHTHESSDTLGQSSNAPRHVQTDEAVVNCTDPISHLLVKDEPGPVMTSSPRPSRNLQIMESSDHIDENRYPTHSPSGSNIITLDAMDISETDDDFDEQDDKHNGEDRDEKIEDSDSGSIKDDGAKTVDTDDGKVDIKNHDMTNDEDPACDEDVLESTSF